MSSQHNIMEVKMRFWEYVLDIAIVNRCGEPNEEQQLPAALMPMPRHPDEAGARIRAYLGQLAQAPIANDLDRPNAPPFLPGTGCGCFACDEEVQAGHFLCSASTEDALRLEDDGLLYRQLDQGAWHWYIGL
jgi:hypothetical protein